MQVPCLGEVPDIIVSALLASSVTLLGVMLSNGSNTKRLLRQLCHDAQQKRDDRMAVMHREVYLKAAEELTRAGSYLGRIATLNPTKENIADGLSEFFAISAKVQLVAQPETARRFGELTAQYSEAMFKLMRQAMPVHDANIDIEIASDLYERSRTEVNRILADMQQFNESGQPNAERFEALNRAFTHAAELSATYAAEREGLFEKRAAAHKEFVVLVLQEARSLGTIQLHALASLRAELGLATDMKEYTTRLEANWARIQAQMEATLDKLSTES